MRVSQLRLHVVCDRALVGLTAAVYALVAWTHARAIATTTVQFDDAFIANVAKSVASGNGYSASYYGLHPFHLEITTGPVVVLPAAAMIRIFGNRYWVPSLAYAVIVGFLIVELLDLLRRRLPGGTALAATLLIGLGLYAFSPQEIGLLGEVPAALIIATAAVIVTQPRTEWPISEEIGGLVFGAALLTKAVAALALPAFVLTILLVPAYAGRRARAVVTFLASAFAPVAIFELWKFGSLGRFDEWVDLVSAEWADFAGPSAALSGSATLVPAFHSPMLLVRNAAVHAPLLAKWLGGTRNPFFPPVWLKGWVPTGAAIASTICAIVAARRSAGSRGRHPMIDSGLLLLGVAGTSAIWWLAFAPMGWLRHFLPGLLCLVVGLAIVSAAASQRSPGWAGAAAVLLVVALGPNIMNVREPFDDAYDLLDDLRTGGPSRTARVNALVATAEYLGAVERSDPGARLVGCGWAHNPSLEFLLPGQDHFRDCILVRGDDLKGRRLLLVRGEYFNQLYLPDIERFRSWCEQHVLFRALSWVVSECPGPPPEPPWTPIVE